MENNDEIMLPHDWTEIFALLNKNRKESLTDGEQARLDRWLESNEENKLLYAEIMNPEWVIEELKKYREVENRMMLVGEKLFSGSEELLSDRAGVRVREINLIPRLTVAASILMVLSITLYYILGASKPQKAETSVVEVKANDVAPGTQTARLTLSTGEVVLLDKSKTGVLARESGSEIFSKDGQLVYKIVNGSSASESIYNTLTTGRGETFSTILADGSTVWLNAGSSIRYPLVFGIERTVELEYGEAYLEVSHNKKPFIVKGIHGKVEVQGTHFNVREYADEPMITSLLDGKVKVEHEDNKQAILMPGQQAVYNKDSKRLSVGKGDVEGAASWVYGVIHFDNANLKEVLRELSRWYNVEIEIRSSSDVKMYGGFERNIPLSEMLDVLSKMAQVKFKIEGKKIIVLP